MKLVGTNGVGLQTWSLPAYLNGGAPPLSGLSATNIYAIGFIGTQQQNKIDYPYTGASDIAVHLY